LAIAKQRTAGPENRRCFSGSAIFVALFLAVFVLSGCHSPAAPEEPVVPAFDVRQAGLVANPALVESSGMAHSRPEGDLLWVANDNGHPPILFAVGSDGSDQGMVTVQGADNTDWEDLAAFEVEGQAYILIADIGDNQALRDTCRMYVVPEPARQLGGGFPDQVDVAWQFAFRYEDGPRDGEGAAVDTADGQILLLTKRTSPPQLYVLPLRPPAGALVTAKRIGTVPHIPPPTAQDLIANPRFGAFQSQPTALDIRGDNRLAVVLTYKDAYLFPRRNGATWAEALARPPLAVNLPELKQKETACLTPDGRILYVSTEQRPTPLLAVALEPAP
jgi:hypothetical protein